MCGNAQAKGKKIEFGCWIKSKLKKNVGNESKPNKNLNRKDHIEDRVREKIE